jgi:hypothetical protein
MNRTQKPVTNSDARASEAAPPLHDSIDSLRDKVDALRFTLVVVATQILFRTTLLLRRWNY